MKEENKIIVADLGWAEDIPEWVLNEIRSERLVNGMINVVANGKDEVGNAEIVAYLMTASNRGPLSHNFTEIYLFLTSELMIKCKGLTKDTLPDFLKETYEKGLNSDQERELENLRYDILKKRGKVNHPLFNLLKELKGGKK